MPRHRSNGEGDIHQRPDGRWEARLHLGWRNGKRVRRSVYGRTKAEVAKKLRAAHHKHDRGLPLGDGRMTVKSWLEHWLRLQRRSEKAANTIIQYEWAINKHLVPVLGDYKLQELNADHVDELLGELADAGAAKNTMMRVRSVLNMALDEAVRRDMVARNVSALTKTPAGAFTRSRSLTVQQARALLEAAEGDRLGPAYSVALMLGTRPGETLGLAWDLVDLDLGHIRIQQQVTNERGVLVMGRLKTAGSIRTIAAPRQVIDLLRARRKQQLEERMAAGPAWIETGLVFTTQVGTPIDPRNFRRSFDRVTARAGLGHWTPNELRHSAVSLLLAAGVPESDVADMVGHVTTRMTHEVYRHQLAPAVSAGKAAMEQMFAADHEVDAGTRGRRSPADSTRAKSAGRTRPY
jgi:integrase